MIKKRIIKHNDYTRYVIFVMGFVALILFLNFLMKSDKTRAAIYISIFIILNTIITGYKKFIRIPVEIEVLTLGIVLCTMKFGLNAGLIIGLVGGLLGFFVGLEISPFAFPMFIGYVSMAFAAFLFRGIGDVTTVGLLTAFVNNIIVFSIYHFIFGYDVMKNIRFSFSNIALNIVLFFNLAPFLARFIV